MNASSCSCARVFDVIWVVLWFAQLAVVLTVTGSLISLGMALKTDWLRLMCGVYSTTHGAHRKDLGVRPTATQQCLPAENRELVAHA